MKTLVKTPKKEIDMLNGSLIPSIIKFTIPIAVSSILQQLFNAADTTVVGNFAGSNALAAVGSNSELVALIVTISSGLAIGSNVLVAKYFGSGRKNEIPKAITSSIFFSLVVGILGMLCGIIFSNSILSALNTPPKVFDQALSYFRIYLLGYPFLVLYDFCSALLRGRGDSKRPFIVLIISGCINVILNLVFVIGFHRGVVGVAVATDIANMFSCITMIILLMREQDEFKLSFKKFKISIECIKSILIIGIPAAVQGAVFCFANLFVTASVNSFGETATSGSTISINYEYFAYYIITAFAQAATTFTSQNYSAGNMERCRKILKYCIIFDIIFTAVLTVPATVFSHFFASIFSKDSAVIKMAAKRMRIILALEPFCAIYEVLAGSLRGKGYSLQPALTAIIGICVVRITWILTVFKRIHTLKSLFVIFPGSWIVTNVLMICLYEVIAYINKRKSQTK